MKSKKKKLKKILLVLLPFIRFSKGFRKFHDLGLLNSNFCDLWNKADLKLIWYNIFNFCSLLLGNAMQEKAINEY